MLRLNPPTRTMTQASGAARATTRLAHRVVPSTRNVRIERFWNEVNMRVHLPALKMLLIRNMERGGLHE
eukprot:2468297-Prymnesium_polylepis.1